MAIIDKLARSGTARARAVALISVLGALGTAATALPLGCSGTTTATTAYAYDDPYVYTTYYPADVAYSSYYWADAWDYSTWYYYYVAPTPIAGDGGMHADAGARDAGVADGGGTGGADGGTDGGTGANVAKGVFGAIEALARGMDVCPGHVTITPKDTTPACDDGSTTSERNGVNLVFSGCQVGQVTIDGTVDLAINRSASEPTCSSSTLITLQSTLTVTNLSVTRNGGLKIVVPSQTATGTATHPFGQNPTALEVNEVGELQLFDSSGTMQNDLTFTGQDHYTLNGSQSYTVDGTSMFQEKNNSAVTATVTKSGLTRSGGCCRPTAGSVTIDRRGGAHPGTTTWSFGPACGTIMRNGATVTLPNCIDQ